MLLVRVTPTDGSSPATLSIAPRTKKCLPAVSAAVLAVFGFEDVHHVCFLAEELGDGVEQPGVDLYAPQDGVLHDAVVKLHHVA